MYVYYHVCVWRDFILFLLSIYLSIYHLLNHFFDLPTPLLHFLRLLFLSLLSESKMSVLDFVLHTLNAIQRKWVYLEPIFSRGALPSEEGRFRRIDEGFTDIVNLVAKDPKLFYLADEQIHPQLSNTLQVMLDQLERCQKALTDFLEAKRSAMPRFYFIG